MLENYSEQQKRRSLTKKSISMLDFIIMAVRFSYSSELWHHLFPFSLYWNLCARALVYSNLLNELRAFVLWTFPVLLGYMCHKWVREILLCFNLWLAIRLLNTIENLSMASITVQVWNNIKICFDLFLKILDLYYVNNIIINYLIYVVYLNV